MKQTALGLWYPEDTDAPNGPQQIKELAEAADALDQLGGANAAHIYVEEATRENVAYGSFSTPIKVSLPKVASKQLVKIGFYLLVAGTASATNIRLNVNGTTALVGAAEITAAGGTNTALYTPFSSVGSGITSTAPIEGTSIGAFTTIVNNTPQMLGLVPMHFSAPTSESKPFTVEIQGKLAAGKATVKLAMLWAQAVA